MEPDVEEINESSPEKVKVIIRKANPDDKDLLLSTWLQNQYFSSPDYFQAVPKEIYYPCYTAVIKQILFTPGVDINVACDQAHPNWVVGFCVFKADSIYWIYVKKDYRLQGIANLLIPQNTVIRVARSLTNWRALTKIGRCLVEEHDLDVLAFDMS